MAAVDCLAIVSHDKFQEIVDYAKSPDSIIRGGLRIINITNEKIKAVDAPPEIIYRIEGSGTSSLVKEEQLFDNSAEREAAKVTLNVIQREFERLPRSADLAKPEIQKQIVARVKEIIAPAQAELEGIGEKVDVAKVVANAIALRNEFSIDIPRITVQPVGDVSRGYKEFKLDLSKVRLQPVDNEILIQELYRQEQRRLASGSGITLEDRPENYLIRGLVDFNDISYEEHASLLYKLAGQTVGHLRSYLKKEDEVVNVLQYHQQNLVNLIHAQMQEHFEDKATAYEANVSKGFITLDLLPFT